ncbi:MAG: hypothetical protein WC330_01450 [Candidatus Omnitrophota bacterium]|jgi:hypothetical protein
MFDMFRIGRWLSSSNEINRLSGVKAIASRNRNEISFKRRDLDILIGLLGDPSEIVRNEVVDALCEKKIDVQDHLATTLKCPNPLARLAAAKALSKLADKCTLTSASIDALAQAMGTSDDDLTFCVAETLIQLRDKRGVHALARLANKRCVEPLIMALTHFDCQEAAEALGAIGDIRAVESLLKALETNRRIAMQKEDGGNVRTCTAIDNATAIEKALVRLGAAFPKPNLEAGARKDPVKNSKEALRESILYEVGPGNMQLAERSRILALGQGAVPILIDLFRNPSTPNGDINQAVVADALIEFSKQGDKEAYAFIKQIALGRIPLCASWGREALEIIQQHFAWLGVDPAKDA